MHSVLHAFAHSVVWASVVASVFVAAFVTLVIEYLAKPRLEVRKERILEKSREQRKAISELRRALNIANRLPAFKGQSPQIADLMGDHIKRNAVELQERTFGASGFKPVPQSISHEWEYALSSMNAFATTLSVDLQYMPDGFWEQFEEAFSQMRNFYRLLTTSRWHPLRRSKLIRRIAASPAPSTFIPASERDSLAG